MAESTRWEKEYARTSEEAADARAAVEALPPVTEFPISGPNATDFDPIGFPLSKPDRVPNPLGIKTIEPNDAA